MTPDLDALARMLEKATAGPWGNSFLDPHGKRVISPAGDAELGNWLVADMRWKEDADLVIALRNAAPWLIERARRTARVEEALLTAIKTMEAMRGVIAEAPPETWGVDGMGGEEAHLQRWWPKQEEHLHYADKDIATARAALAAGQPAEKIT